MSDCKAMMACRAAWYGFDAGNSVYAVLVATVGFSVYFKDILAPELAPTVQPESLWGYITALILASAALLSPVLGSWAQHHHHVGRVLMLTTAVSIGATALLGSPLVNYPRVGVVAYVVSAIGFYLALPVYDSLMVGLVPASDQAADGLQKVSARGWAFGYLGGIFGVVAAVALGLLDAGVEDAPTNYQRMFLLAAVLNAAFSIPLLWITWRREPSVDSQPSTWALSSLVAVFADQGGRAFARLMVSNWCIGEAITIVLYFTAIYLTTFGGYSIKSVMIWTIAVQFIAAVALFVHSKFLSRHITAAQAFRLAGIAWVLVPLLMVVAATSPLPFAVPLCVAGVFLGLVQAVVRAEVGSIARILAQNVSASHIGALWGYLSAVGRLSSVLGPVVMAVATMFVSLKFSFALAALFPFIGLILVRRYVWTTELTA